MFDNLYQCNRSETSEANSECVKAVQQNHHIRFYEIIVVLDILTEID
jgi:hypothetical protein